MVVVAQLVEPQIVVLVVVGSIPIDHPECESPDFVGTFIFSGCHQSRSQTPQLRAWLKLARNL